MLQPPAEEGSPCSSGQSLVGAVIVFHVGHAVSPVELLVHPNGDTTAHSHKVQKHSVVILSVDADEQRTRRPLLNLHVFTWNLPFSKLLCILVELPGHPVAEIAIW